MGRVLDESVVQDTQWNKVHVMHLNRRTIGLEFGVRVGSST